MDDLVTWLRAQLDDDEQVARDAPGPAWAAAIEREGSPGNWRGIKAELVTLPPTKLDDSLSVGAELLRGTSWRVTQHATRWDPARVLAEIAAKRRILDLCTPELDEGTSGARISRLTIHTLAQPYADLPEFLPEWRLDGA